MPQYPPRHLHTTLHVSDATVRRWSEVFSRHLSPNATAKPRRYNEQDVAVMTRIKELSDAGMQITEIDSMLEQFEPPPPTNMLWTDQELYNRLVRMGVMPAIAERIIAKRGQPMPTDAEMDEDAKITDEDLELAAQWWLYNPAVPRKYKRLLHAKKTG